MEALPDVDCVIVSEAREYDSHEYLRDVVLSGEKKGARGVEILLRDSRGTKPVRLDNGREVPFYSSASGNFLVRDPITTCTQYAPGSTSSDARSSASWPARRPTDLA